MACVKCGMPVEEELRIPMRQCSHRVHADCLMSDPESQRSYKKCGLCLGHYAPVKKVESAIRGEPRLLGDRDWVLQPGTRNTGSVVKVVASYIPGIASRVAETAATSTNPFFLLQHRKPIGAIMQENGLGLDHFLQVGVTMRDFLQHGYSWHDVLQYEDVGKRGAHRALQAISNGLRTTANDFRDYPDALPFKEVKAHTKFRNADVCRLFGLTFPDAGSRPGDPLEGGYLECAGDRNWNALDCIEMGLKFSDLKDFGMAYVHQYLQLMGGLSEHDADDADKALGTTDKELQTLIDLEAEAEEEQLQMRKAQEAHQREIERRMAAQRRVAAEEEDRYVEIEKEEEYEQPIYYARRAFNPPPARQEPRHVAPLYEKRMKERARRHGTLIK